MVLYPLAVVLLAQVGLILLGIIIYQRLQKKRLLQELENATRTTSVQEPLLDAELDSPLFDKEQASLLLNRINHSLATIRSEAPVVKDLCHSQEELLVALSDCLDIQLDRQQPQAPAPATEEKPRDSDEILSQEELDEVLGQGPEALDELDDLDDLEGLDDNLDSAVEEPEEYDPLIAPETVDDIEEELPEDTLQQTLDNLDDFDFSDLEQELLKEEDNKR